MNDTRRDGVQSAIWGASGGDGASSGPCVVATGVDLASVEQMRASLERFGDRFTRRIFSTAELAETCGPAQPASLAARFAAKEAAMKVLDVDGRGYDWRDFEIRRSPAGRPQLRLHREARQSAAAQGLTHWSVSLTHEGPMAAAVAVAIRNTYEHSRGEH